MKKNLSIIIMCTALIVFSSFNLTAQEVNILVLMSNNYGPNIFFTLDDFERYGWNVTLVGVTRTLRGCPLSTGLPSIEVDKLVSEVTDITHYDVLVIGFAAWRAGNPYSDILNSAEAMNLIMSAANSGLVLYATCAGVRVLAAAGAIHGKNVVGTAAYQQEYTAAGAHYLGEDHPPVIDGNIVTAVRGQYYHLFNCEAIATALANKSQLNTLDGKHITQSPNTISANHYEHYTLWAKTYGGIGFEGGKAVCETSDGGYMIAGYTYSFGAGFADVYIVKTDVEGNVLWSKTYGGSGYDYGYDVCEASDGSYIITGSTTSSGAGLTDVYIIKINARGNTLWTKTFGGPDIDVGNAIIEANDGGFLVCGHTQSFGAGESDVYLIKVDANGNLLWSQTYGDNRCEMGRSVKKANNGFIIAGATGSPALSSSNQDLYMIRTDAAGNIIWQKAYGTNVPFPFDWGNDAALTSDGGYILVGESNITTPLDVILIKTDAIGNRTWLKNFGDTFYDYGNSVREIEDNCYLVCGATKSRSTLLNDLYLIKTDNEGNDIWIRTYGGDGSDWGNAICLTSDGCYLIVGHTNSYGAGKQDVWLLKISSLEADFSASIVSGRAPLEVQFSDQSNGNITSWKWDFDNDGTIDSEEQHPTWVYQEPGVYTVKFEVSNGRHPLPIIREQYINVFTGVSALMFDGAESYVTIPASPLLNLTNNFTVEAWIHPDGWGEASSFGFGRIIDKVHLSFYLINNVSGFNKQCLGVKLDHSNNVSSFSTTPENSITLGTWQHVAFSYNGDNNTINMYINGLAQDVTQRIAPNGVLKDNTNFDLVIGSNAPHTFTFDGIIDELRIWNTVRDGQDIFNSKDNYLAGNENGLVAYWQLEEGRGDIITDYCGHVENGNIVNALWVQGLGFGTTAIKETTEMPQVKNITLFNNYPNPFNPETIIRFQIVHHAHVVLSIFNLNGELVKLLINEDLDAGQHAITWDGKNEQGFKMSSGVYLYRLKVNEAYTTKKMLLVK